jgi:hypothetical protein
MAACSLARSIQTGRENVCQRRNSTNKEGNHEEDALEHCLGSSRIVGMGADHAAAAYE